MKANHRLLVVSCRGSIIYVLQFLVCGLVDIVRALSEEPCIQYVRFVSRLLIFRQVNAMNHVVIPHCSDKTRRQGLVLASNLQRYSNTFAVNRRHERLQQACIVYAWLERRRSLQVKDFCSKRFTDFCHLIKNHERLILRLKLILVSHVPTASHRELEMRRNLTPP